MTKQPKANNRFADLLGARDTDQPENNSAEAESEADTTPRRKGKRLNKEYVQISAYVRKDTHKKVKAALIFDEESGDFSDLMEQLLQEWLARQA